MTLRMILALATATLLSVNVSAIDKVVYGEDNRFRSFRSKLTLYIMN